MPNLIPWGKPRGAVHSVATALDYGDGGTNILVVSDAGLYAVQNLVERDLAFSSRWADEISEFGFVPISEQSANYEAWHDLVLRIQTEVIPVSSIDVHQFAWNGNAWVQAPLPLGYQDTLREAGGTDNLAAGTNSVQLIVPDGVVWVVTNIAYIYNGTAPAAVTAEIVTPGPSGYPLWTESPIPTSKWLGHQGYWVLKDADYINVIVYGATAGDDFYVTITGHKFEF